MALRESVKDSSHNVPLCFLVYTLLNASGKVDKICQVLTLKPEAH